MNPSLPNPPLNLHPAPLLYSATPGSSHSLFRVSNNNRPARHISQVQFLLPRICPHYPISVVAKHHSPTTDHADITAATTITYTYLAHPRITTGHPRQRRLLQFNCNGLQSKIEEIVACMSRERVLIVRPRN